MMKEEMIRMESIKRYSSDSEDEEHDIDFSSFQIFSQSYSKNIMNKGSIFLYIPWRPSINSLKRIQTASTTALSSLAIASKYKWHDVNRLIPMKYHISLYPNIEGEDYKIEQLKDNIEHSLSQLRINGVLVGTDNDEIKRYENLKSVLGNCPIPKRYVNLSFHSHLQVYPSTRKDTLFLAGRIVQNPEITLFFEELNDMIYRNANSLGLAYKKPPPPDYHISLQVGELQRAEFTPDLNDINKILNAIEVDLDQINVNISELVISSIGTHKSTKILQLPT